ncbi:ATP-binding protein [Dyella sp. C11]|uniref:sensor histidine kinase n=1 Tax=Dyella sp. C11 TaxID=2126991 RepID=UPI0018E54F42|nr:ATP-binding protein [Dyella sp. C11]
MASILAMLAIALCSIFGATLDRSHHDERLASPWAEGAGSIPVRLSPSNDTHEDFGWLGSLLLFNFAFLATAARKAQKYRRSVVRQLEKARSDERIAMARDLHDTLLQSVQAVLLQVNAMAMDVTDPLMKRRLQVLEELSREAVLEGKARILRLRDSLAEAPLVERLGRRGRTLQGIHGGSFSITQSGPERLLKPSLADELVLIASELMTNAFRHASASRIRVRITFALRQVIILVEDDGSGIDLPRHQGALSGHWGLVGVQERSRLIGASIWMRSKIGSGTTFRVAVKYGEPCLDDDQRPNTPMAPGGHVVNVHALDEMRT